MAGYPRSPAVSEKNTSVKVKVFDNIYFKNQSVVSEISLIQVEYYFIFKTSQ